MELLTVRYLQMHWNREVTLLNALSLMHPMKAAIMSALGPPNFDKLVFATTLLF